MPVAEQFNALGVGNGFPYCLPKVDVSSYDYWITLGGTQRGSSPTQDEIDLSLFNAMKLYWNYNGHTGTWRGGIDGFRQFTIDIDKGIGKSPPFSPKDRVCINDNAWTASLNDPGLIFQTSFSTSFIVRMYNGDPNNEDNFAGYGINGGFRLSYASFAFPSSFDFISYANDIEGFADLSIYSTSMAGIPFVSRAIAQVFDPGSISISGLKATFNRNGFPQETLTYSDINFYTY